MFGSQVLDTIIGLVALFLVLALGASSAVEVVARLLSKRGRDLERGIKAMLAGSDASSQDLEEAFDIFKGTTIYDSARAASGKSIFRQWKRPSYLSAKGFADAISEIERLDDAGLEDLPNVKLRVEAIRDEFGDDITKTKAELESWFDSTMERLSGSYKRFSTLWLFFFGLIFAIGANASVFHVADELWNDSVLADAVADAVTVEVPGDQSANTNGQTSAEIDLGEEIRSIADATSQLEELQLPIGWSDEDQTLWDDWNSPQDWSANQWGFLFGWIVTALLVMQGAPFWFDVLTKAVSLREAGSKPPEAPHDDTSATSILLAKNKPAESNITFNLAPSDTSTGGES